MAFREVLVTQVKQVLLEWLAGAGKRPAARRAGVDVKTANRYIHAAQAAGLARDRNESQLTDELLGMVVAAVRPARPAGHGASWESLAERRDDITGWVKAGLTLVKIHELLERSGTAVPYRTLARFAAEECRYSSSSWQQVTVPVADSKLAAARFDRGPREFATATGVRMQVLPGGGSGRSLTRARTARQSISSHFVSPIHRMHLASPRWDARQEGNR